MLENFTKHEPSNANNTHKNNDINENISSNNSTKKSPGSITTEKSHDPDDYDIDTYYEDYKDEFYDEDDAWDDFEDY